MKDGFMEAVDIEQNESFKAGVLFAQTEGIIPAPESCHAIAATVREALKCKETGEQKTILFNLSGHGFVDMSAYDQYISGELQDFHVSDEELARYMASADALNK
jgi:tryptophan synthase beta chain